jgi:drug/metabolite transporter (DMT)-like permease
MEPSSLSVALALGAAAGAGFADYLAAHAARRMPAIRVAAWIQSFGLAVVVALALLWGGPPTLSATDLVASTLAGLSIAVGISALYGALAIGPIGVTAPTAAVTGAALPVVVAVGLGETLGALQYAGLLAGLVGVALFASGPVGKTSADKTRGIGLALLAGLGIGGFTIGLHGIDAAAGLWPLALARSVAAATLWLVASRQRGGPAGRGARGSRLWIAGLLDGAAMVAFVIALQVGQMAIVAVLASLYPAFTVGLAALIDRERLQRAQLAGLAFAAAAVVLVSGFG